MKQSLTSTSSAGIAVDSEERKAIDDVTVIEERNEIKKQEKWCESYIDLSFRF